MTDKKYIGESSFEEMANAIRMLSADAVEKAKSGHPGMPLGMADVVTILFAEFLKFNPHNPEWPDRDRFILSAGHGSMLLYSLLYLTGYEDITLNEIKNFRQLGSHTAGHPEFGYARGIETTTGPLGQGFANAVGMAIAERIMNAKFGDNIINHYTYVIASDGDLMEGINHEAAEIAAHLNLNKLIVLFDDNNITIDGKISLSRSSDQLKRYESYGWYTQQIDGHNPRQIREALQNALKSDKPSIIGCKTIIGKFAPTKAGSEKCHGSPLGEEEIKGLRKNLDWPHEPFVIPEKIKRSWEETGGRNKKNYEVWLNNFDGLNKELQKEFDRRLANEIPSQLGHELLEFKKQIFVEKPKEATRKSSARVLEVLTRNMPELISGSADLGGSNLTNSNKRPSVSKGNFSGTNINWGIREHAMAAAMNGISLHGGVRPYGGTFLTFLDYCKPAVRLSALMKQPVIYVFTHDSIGLGEDGPTHQPIEHLWSARMIPNMYVFRPADAIETLEAYQYIIAELKDAPSILALSRQDIPHIRKEFTEENLTARGGYIISPSQIGAVVTLIATGSEVSIAIEAQKSLESENIGARVISMPCLELFNTQTDEYKNEVLGKNTLKVVVEAGCRGGWGDTIGHNGLFIGMEGFGASGSAEKLYKYFHITSEDIVSRVRRKLAKYNVGDDEDGCHPGCCD